MLNGMKPPARAELPRVEDRITFFYTDNCRLEKDDGAVRIEAEEGSIEVPAGNLCVLMLGPGTTVTHRMIQTAAETGMSIVWCGERGVRFYAGGSPLSGDTKLLTRQAAIVSDRRQRLAAAKRMYGLRYPGEDLSGYSMKQLLGREGSRVARNYRLMSEQYGVPWNGRRYDPEDYDSNDPLQNALSCANACLYGICYAVVFALGLSPGLGIVHNGMSKSFILDIADIYKEKTSLPVSFSIVAKGTGEIEHRVRMAMRQGMKNVRFLKMIVSDINYILAPDGSQGEVMEEGRNELWAGFQQNVSGGTEYGK